MESTKSRGSQTKKPHKTTSREHTKFPATTTSKIKYFWRNHIKKKMINSFLLAASTWTCQWIITKYFATNQIIFGWNPLVHNSSSKKWNFKRHYFIQNKLHRRSTHLLFFLTQNMIHSFKHDIISKRTRPKEKFKKDQIIQWLIFAQQTFTISYSD